MNNESIIDNLDRDKVAIANTIVNLTYQGYVVNKHKYNRLALNNLLTKLYHRYNHLTDEQRDNLNIMYNKYLISYHG
jgi:hypothetical protein